MTDLHVHSLFCDGKSSPEDEVRAAIAKGVGVLGIVAHSYVPFDSCCIRPENVARFIGEMSRLKEKYRGQIELYCGLEADLYSPEIPDGFDYTIGSVHYLKHGGEYISVDDTPEILAGMIERHYGGDAVECAVDYFETVKQLKEMRPDIIGHFDLIKKFRRAVPIDEHDGRYIAAWQSAARELLTLGVPFEINTGGILRGWLDEPYPSREIADFIKANGGRLILSSDAHSAEDIAAGFEEFGEWR